MSELPTPRHARLHTQSPVAELPVGTRVWFQLGTGTVVVGELLEGTPWDHGYCWNDENDARRVARVEIDIDTPPSSGNRPAHVAPRHVQPTETLNNGWFFRDAFTVSAAEQTYIVTDEVLVRVLED